MTLFHGATTGTIPCGVGCVSCIAQLPMSFPASCATLRACAYVYVHVRMCACNVWLSVVSPLPLPFSPFLTTRLPHVHVMPTRGIDARLNFLLEVLDAFASHSSTPRCHPCCAGSKGAKVRRCVRLFVANSTLQGDH